MLRIGMVQTEIQEGSTEANKEHIERLVQKHSAEGLDLLCFPELCISGYDYEAAAASNDEGEFFSRLAKGYSINILAGVHIKDAPKDAQNDGRHYDACCAWNSEGNCIAEYRKIHLYLSENEFFSRGDALALFEIKNWKIGILICADLGFPEVSRALAERGAEAIVYPSAWGPGWEDLFVTAAKMRAAENQVYVVALNRASREKRFCGNSVVANPDGSVLAREASSEEKFIGATLTKSASLNARDATTWNSIKRKDLYRTLF